MTTVRRQHLVVIEATNPPDGTTRYIDQVVTYASADVTFRYLSVRTVLGRHLDVLHLHWPDVFLRASNPLVRAARCLAFLLLLLFVRVRGAAIIRTLHNLHPHESVSPLEAWTLRMVDRLTTFWVRINAVTPDRQPGCYIPHGHYRDRFAQHPRREPQQGRVAYAGLIRPYKGVERLLALVPELAASGIHLRLVGRPTPELREQVTLAQEQNNNVSSILDFVPDSVLVEELSGSELVCLPYDELHNSGMLLVALSLNLPVLVPDAPATREMAREVGDAWIRRYEGTLQTEDILAALEAVRLIPPGEVPSLGSRDWQRVGSMYSDAFWRAAGRASQRDPDCAAGRVVRQ